MGEKGEIGTAEQQKPSTGLTEPQDRFLRELNKPVPNESHLAAEAREMAYRIEKNGANAINGSGDTRQQGLELLKKDAANLEKEPSDFRDAVKEKLAAYDSTELARKGILPKLTLSSGSTAMIIGSELTSEGIKSMDVSKSSAHVWE